jgi:7-cyano-7-deazaguanine synthase in queuosine biosynthesis
VETQYNKFKSVFQPILEQKNTIALFLSGGLDSAVCVYCMMKISQELNLQNQFKLYNFTGSELQCAAAINVKNYLNTLTGFEFEFNYVDDMRAAPSLSVLQYDKTRELMQDENIDMILRFDNQVPEHLKSIPTAPGRVKWQNEKFDVPVFDFYKDEIVALGLELNLENLIELTKSCLQEQEVRCGECFQCQERAWAFEQAGATDPGTM